MFTENGSILKKLVLEKPPTNDTFLGFLIKKITWKVGYKY